MDYIHDGESGILIDPYDVTALVREAHHLMTDRARARSLAQKALEEIRSRHTFDQHAQMRLDTIAAIWRG